MVTIPKWTFANSQKFKLKTLATKRTVRTTTKDHIYDQYLLIKTKDDRSKSMTGKAANELKPFL